MFNTLCVVGNGWVLVLPDDFHTGRVDLRREARLGSVVDLSRREGVEELDLPQTTHLESASGDEGHPLGRVDEERHGEAITAGPGVHDAVHGARQLAKRVHRHHIAHVHHERTVGRVCRDPLAVLALDLEPGTAGRHEQCDQVDVGVGTTPFDVFTPVERRVVDDTEQVLTTVGPTGEELRRTTEVDGERPEDALANSLQLCQELEHGGSELRHLVRELVAHHALRVVDVPELHAVGLLVSHRNLGVDGRVAHLPPLFLELVGETLLERHARREDLFREVEASVDNALVDPMTDNRHEADVTEVSTHVSSDLAVRGLIATESREIQNGDTAHG